MLPTHEEIEKWSDEKLNTVIEAGERCKWDISCGESREEIDYYMECLYNAQLARSDRKLGLTSPNK
jgi:hypothetical protein